MEKDKQHSQSIQIAFSGRNTTQIGGNYVSKTNISLSIWISILLVIALGSYVTLGTDSLDRVFQYQGFSNDQSLHQ